MDEATKQELQQQFSDYLDQEFTPAPPDETVDMMSFFQELAALKNEVRIESRQLKTALDDFRSAFMSLDDGRQEIVDLLRSDGGGKGQSDTLMEEMTQGLIELHDRVAMGLEQKPPTPTYLQRLTGNTRSTKWLEGYQAGQEIVLDRILELLRLIGIVPIHSIDAAFDPQSMKAEGVDADPTRDEGVVLREFRKGFIQGERVVRPGEVIVNKLSR